MVIFALNVVQRIAVDLMERLYTRPFHLGKYANKVGFKVEYKPISVIYDIYTLIKSEW